MFVGNLRITFVVETGGVFAEPELVFVLMDSNYAAVSNVVECSSSRSKVELFTTNCEMNGGTFRDEVEFLRRTAKLSMSNCGEL